MDLDSPSLLHSPRARGRFKPEAPFAPYSKSLLMSTAFRSLSVNARKCFDRLMVEHLAHRMLENGRLVVTFDDFYGYGVTRENITASIAELAAFGLVEVMERGGLYVGERRPNLYRLTMFVTFDIRAPTDEWKAITAADVVAFRKDQREREQTRKARKASLKATRAEIDQEEVVRPKRSSTFGVRLAGMTGD